MHARPTDRLPICAAVLAVLCFCAAVFAPAVFAQDSAQGITEDTAVIAKHHRAPPPAEPPRDLTAAEEGAQNPPPRALDDEAQRIYRKYGGALYQIQVIDLVSEKKTSIGSGFQFTADGMVATNYHVIADAVMRPDANRLEYVHDRHGTGRLKILTADVRHDIAILQMETPNPEYLLLGRSDLPKGARLYSLGNPHDIGFTIVEGNYNGVSRDSFIDKIHFSGAVNPGMSGGPVLGHDGRVAGINVMTAGNQIGFLVPIEPLKALAESYAARAPDHDFTRDAAKLIEAQLHAAQEAVQARLDAGNWTTMPFGRVLVPGRIDPAFKCWAAQRHTEKSPYTHYRTTCATEDNIYIDEGFTTGAYSYSYDLLRARRGFGSLRFYSAYAQLYAAPESQYMTMNLREKDAENFECLDRFVTHGGQRWKASFCARRYKLYPSLYDSVLFMAQLGESREGLIVTLSAQGVTRENALALTRRFMQSLLPVRSDAVPLLPLDDAAGGDTP